MMNLLPKIKIAAFVLLYGTVIVSGTTICLQKHAKLAELKKEYEAQQLEIKQCLADVDMYKSYQRRIREEKEFFEKILHDYGYVSLYELEIQY